MATVYVSIGSNINREHHITESIHALNNRFAPLRISNFYDCQSVGFEGDNFLNLVVGFECDLPVAQLAKVLHQIELENDRKRETKAYASRTLDIDILLYGNQVGIIDGVELPRCEITEYAFVLRPLVDVAAQELHPTLNISFQHIWNNFDQLSQKTELIPFKLSFTESLQLP
ncbi:MULTISPECIES: 2-amino-4-hydroxy-6-hydroxymethyldihydropteridine diphosphokinase [Vibrio]|jgi:2-amino-4-hydroxy-6-hydroxymethyldihydropteridine diphosphokinase|uniref:2-amino-4-hydroxy-6- hydroxymethyldihydropteridine diphosphokinase n=1 Tax=Vibrio TaxID=662 RepID=UPI000BFFCA29|nr:MULTISPECIES: 2-amino-4-hydroxy-6-hydroxymethyldihydropteridine diphosphokinase [unclassified Vibrio]PHJ43388.1 2-amino-4-hydroxy-6-hydroxymethyldihydropteridine pyrophosphokinase [Vibrio sp. PID17_43]RIZ55233.1 2-amino-4-hydroxy-6-hydroxymethyldihydropteridine pyrophosphokinase [Vibrio sp. PID23_8]